VQGAAGHAQVGVPAQAVHAELTPPSWFSRR
jgi:hypothetical protein